MVRTRPSSLLRRGRFFEIHIDDDVRQCIRMLPKLIDFSIRKTVGLFSKQLATARDRHRIGNNVVFVIHNAPHRTRRTVECLLGYADQCAGT